MSSWAAFTWLAIGVLVVGSVAVFLWFLTDAVPLFRALDRPARRGGEEPDEPAPPDGGP